MTPTTPAVTSTVTADEYRLGEVPDHDRAYLTVYRERRRVSEVLSDLSPEGFVQIMTEGAHCYAYVSKDFPVEIEGAVLRVPLAVFASGYCAGRYDKHPLAWSHVDGAWRKVRGAIMGRDIPRLAFDHIRLLFAGGGHGDVPRSHLVHLGDRYPPELRLSEEKSDAACRETEGALKDAERQLAKARASNEYLRERRDLAEQSFEEAVTLLLKRTAQLKRMEHLREEIGKAAARLDRLADRVDEGRRSPRSTAASLRFVGRQLTSLAEDDGTEEEKS